MIVDAHIHLWPSGAQLGRAREGLIRLAGETDVTGLPEASYDQYVAGATKVDHALLLGIASRYLQADLPNRALADAVSKSNGRLIGFAGIDPTARDACDQVRQAHEELGLRGVSVCPAACDCHPADTRAMRLYETAARLGMPVAFHQAGLLTSASKLEFARPLLLDEVARTFGELKILISGVGIPWTAECLVLLAKHPNIFADIAGLTDRPWRAFEVLLSANATGVIDKLLFASGFPFAAAEVCIEGLYSVNHLAHGTNLPTIPRERLRSIVERETLSLLGLASAARRDRPTPRSTTTTATDG